MREVNTATAVGLMGRMGPSTEDGPVPRLRRKTLGRTVGGLKQKVGLVEIICAQVKFMVLGQFSLESQVRSRYMYLKGYSTSTYGGLEENPIHTRKSTCRFVCTLRLTR